MSSLVSFRDGIDPCTIRLLRRCVTTISALASFFPNAIRRDWYPSRLRDETDFGNPAASVVVPSFREISAISSPVVRANTAGR